MNTPQKVLITGAAGALGREVVRRFLQAGTAVCGTYVGARPEIPGVAWIEMNVAKSEDVAEKMPPDVDALVHCAGGFRWTPVESFKDEDMDFLIDTNLKSSFYLLRAVLPGMKKRGFGRIVLVSAKATRSGAAGMGPYAASKAGINLLTESVNEELKGFDICVNAVLPSVIDTPANRKDMPQADFSAWVPPAELAEIIFSLTQPWGRSIRGALIPVSGRI